MGIPGRLARTGLLLCLSLACAAAPAYANKGKKNEKIPGTAVLLPLAKGVHISWVQQPMVDPGNTKEQKPAAVFAVDSKGVPWFGDGKNTVASPAKGVIFGLDLAYDDFTVGGDGGMVFSSRNTLGLAVPSKKARLDKRKRALVALQPLVKAPLSHMNLYPAPQGLYLSGPDKDGYALYYLDAADKGKASFKKLLQSADPILAVAGDGDRAFASLGKLVVSLDGQDDVKATGFFKSKRPVTGLAWLPDAGLFYATDSGAGYVNPDNRRRIDFLEAKNLKLFASKGALYLYVPKVQGVSRLDGADQFKKLLAR
jgi:hypothetical protein